MKFLAALFTLVVAVAAAAPQLKQQESTAAAQGADLRFAPEARYLDQSPFTNQQPHYLNYQHQHPDDLYLRNAAEHRYLSQQPLLYSSKEAVDRNQFLRYPSYAHQEGSAIKEATERNQLLRYPTHAHQEGGAVILEQDNQMPEVGHYLYRYKTNNGIEVAEQAALRSLGPEAVETVQGEYSWVAPNGEKFSVQYVADENGYHPQGAHIPAIPAAIARSLEWNAAHPEEDPEVRRYRYN